MAATGESKWNRLHMTDAGILLLLLLLISLFAVRFVDFSIAPFEDAAILMRYADHLARGHGIVWNIGEKPVDGATDFLFMILLGLLVKTGLSLEFATRFIGFSSHSLYSTARLSDVRCCSPSQRSSPHWSDPKA